MTLCAQGSPRSDEMSSPAGLQDSVHVLLSSLADPPCQDSPNRREAIPQGHPQGQRPLCACRFSGWLSVPYHSLSLLQME